MTKQPRTACTFLLATGLMLTAGCAKDEATQMQIDVLIANGEVYTGNSSTPQALDVAICGAKFAAYTHRATQKRELKK